MNEHILWLDNDPGQIDSIVKALERHGYNMTVSRTVSDAAARLEAERFDLVVLDVMIPVTDAELAEYPYEQTDNTLATGLLFYKRVADQLAAAGVPVVVMTVRIDRAIAAAFKQAGLPERLFITRHEVKNTQTLLARIDEILRDSNER